jgi:hypothetical protein
MGAGILISGASLVADGLRHLLPNRGVRRRLNVMRGVRRIVVELADAAGIEIEERNLAQRRRRSRWMYLLVASGAIPLAYLAGRWGFDVFNSTGSAVKGNAMFIIYGLIVATLAGATGLMALALSVPKLDGSLMCWIIAHAVFGRLTGPPVGIAERAQLLIPNLSKGAGP